MNKKRILYFSHGHPEFSKGGAEVASYNLYKGMAKHFDTFYMAAFLDDISEKKENLIPLRPGEYLFNFDFKKYSHFKQTYEYEKPELTKILTFIEQLNLDYIHFHHFVYFGLNLVKIIKIKFPKIKIIFSLHEYLSICLHNGQMVKKNDFGLCNEAGQLQCKKCFPSITFEKIKQRELLIKSYFLFVDQFHSPSSFLKEKYVKWGISAEKIRVVENMVFVKGGAGSLNNGEFSKKITFGYFGQINKYKNIELLLDVILILSQIEKYEFQLIINGANLDIQENEYRKRIVEKINFLEEKSLVVNAGSYSQEDLMGRMKNIDCIIIPSRWWENSPIVIQEALLFKKPIIGTNIGGVSEKIGVENINFLFENNSVVSLLEVLKNFCDGTIKFNEKLFEKAQRTQDNLNKEYFDLYSDEI